MSESTALVPVPTLAPVRTGTGSFFQFGKLFKSPLLLEQSVRRGSFEPDDGMAYCRDGHFVGRTCIGIMVNVYV